METYHPETDLSRFYRAELDHQFIRLEMVGEKPELSNEELRELLEDPSNLARYEELLPPDRFEFRGVSIVHAMDVTESEALSRLKQDLIVQNALVSPDSLDCIEQRIQSLLGHNDVQTGIIALDRCETGEVSGARQIDRSTHPGNRYPQDPRRHVDPGGRSVVQGLPQAGGICCRYCCCGRVDDFKSVAGRLCLSNGDRRNRSRNFCT